MDDKTEKEKAKEYRLRNKDKIIARRRDYYLRNKAKLAEKSKAYYFKNKTKTLAWKKKYRDKNKDKMEAYRTVYKNEARRFWNENANPDASKIAEDIILKNILSKLGFTEQFKPIANFYFDSLAKKNGIICAIEVTTQWDRAMDKMHIELLDYLNLPLYLFFVKPDLTMFFLAERQPLSKCRAFSYKQAKEFVIGKDIQGCLAIQSTQ